MRCCARIGRNARPIHPFLSVCLDVPLLGSAHGFPVPANSQAPVPLAEAALALVGDVPAPRRAKTVVTVERRLYDIGSILASLDLIEKTYLGKRCRSVPLLSTE
jgi:E2F/DP family winged-helix DNA-binding domain